MTDNFFKRRREELGLSQFQMALKTGVSVGAISGWERGQIPSIDLVSSIASSYQVATRQVLDVMLEMSESRKSESRKAGAASR
jgi:transcriptional regulator with XRE-family HTH domain